MYKSSTPTPEEVARAFATDPAKATEQTRSLLGKLPEECLEAACAAHPDFALTLKAERHDSFKSWAAACSADPYMIKGAPNEIQAKLAERIIETNPRHLDAIPYDLRTRETCLKAVKRDGETLEFVPTHFKDDEICKTAVGNNPRAMKFISKTFWSDLSRVNSNGSMDWRTPEWMETARESNPEIDQWIPETVLSAKAAEEASVKAEVAGEADATAGKEESPITAKRQERTIRVHPYSDTREGKILAPDGDTLFEFGGRKFASIEAAFNATKRQFPEMAKDEIKLMATIYMKASQFDPKIKEALTALESKEIAPDASYDNKAKHPAGRFAIAAALNKVRLGMGLKQAPIPYVLDGSPFEPPYKPGYLYERQEAGRRYEKWLRAFIKSRVSSQGLDDISKIASAASSGSKVNIHSSFPEAAEVFAKTISAIYEKTAKDGMDLESAIGEPCAPEAAFIRHKTANQRRAERATSKVISMTSANPESRVLKFTPETYILAAPGSKVPLAEKVELNEMLDLISERKGWKIRYGFVPSPTKIALNIDGAKEGDAKETTYDEMRGILNSMPEGAQKPNMKIQGRNFKTGEVNSDSLEQMETFAKAYPNAKLLKWDAKQVDTVVLSLDGSEVKYAKATTFEDIEKLATKDTTYYIKPGAGDFKKPVKDIEVLKTEWDKHSDAMIYSYGSLTPAPLEGPADIERMLKTMEGAQIFRKPASVKAYMVDTRQQRTVQTSNEAKTEEGQQNAQAGGKATPDKEKSIQQNTWTAAKTTPAAEMAKSIRSLETLEAMAPAVTEIKASGIKNLRDAAKSLNAKVQGATEDKPLDGLTNSEARHAIEKMMALAYIRDLHTGIDKGHQPNAGHLQTLDMAFERLGVNENAIQRLKEAIDIGNLKGSKTYQEMEVIAKVLKDEGTNTPSADEKAARGLIRLLKAECVKGAAAQWDDNVQLEYKNYNDSLELGEDHVDTVSVPKSRVKDMLEENPTLKQVGEEDDMAILEASFFLPDRDKLTSTDDYDFACQFYGEDAIRAQDMPISAIEGAAKTVFSVSDPFMKEPSLETKLEDAASFEELQTKETQKGFDEGHILSRDPKFVYFDEQKGQAGKTASQTQPKIKK